MYVKNTRRSPRRVRARALSILAMVTAVEVTAEPAYWGALEAGPHEVRFELIEAQDPARRFGDQAVRPMTIGVWSPARVEPGAARFDYGVYIESFEAAPDEWLTRLERPEARRDAPGLQTSAVLAGGSDGSRFPLVVYAAGFNSSPTIHVAVAEYLASQGFVVAASASVGRHPEGMTFDSEGLLAQSRDIEFAIGLMSGRADVDTGRIGVAGFSFGGSAAVLAAMRRPDIGAVASLDGAEGMGHAFELMRSAHGYGPDNFRIPFLRIGRPAPELSDRSLVESLLFSDRHWMEATPSEHLDFIPSASFAFAAGDTYEDRALEINRLTIQTLAAFFTATLSQQGERSIEAELRDLVSSQFEHVTVELIVTGAQSAPVQQSSSKREERGRMYRVAATEDGAHWRWIDRLDWRHAFE